MRPADFSYAVLYMQYDRLSQQPLSFLFVYLLHYLFDIIMVHFTEEHCLHVTIVLIGPVHKNCYLYIVIVLMVEMFIIFLDFTDCLHG